MRHEEKRRVPSPGWWKAPEMTIEEFGAEIDRLQAIPFSREEMVFTHDVFVDNFFIGEAAMVEEVTSSLRIGFLSIGNLKNQPPVYGVISPDFLLKPKGFSLPN